ncbi:hypothetical protein KK488_11825 [Sphingobium sp. H33]|uniref:Uncharacterized protein n=1 Tax=Sphingobium nicotianae TaxID=2782607 RepID=A0A9X1DCS0_9SPHN|nr:hypothetical protein [Sphingobium nicotianae]
MLAIGIDPVFSDLSAFPTLTPEIVRAYLDDQIGRIGALGYAVDSCLVDMGATAAEQVEAALRARSYDCIVIGAGLREPPELLLLFETVINLVHSLAPQSRIAFNTTPADTAEAAQRAMG